MTVTKRYFRFKVDASNANDKMRERVEQYAMSAAEYLSNLPYSIMIIMSQTLKECHFRHHTGDGIIVNVDKEGFDAD
jgi:hypothetical protein